VQWGVPFDPVLDIILSDIVLLDVLYSVVSPASYRLCARFLFEAGLAIEDLIVILFRGNCRGSRW